MHNTVLDPDVDADQVQIKLREPNNQAYSDLVLSYTDLTSFDVIDLGCTDALPDGDASLAFQQLINFWEPKTTSNLSKLIKNIKYLH